MRSKLRTLPTCLLMTTAVHLPVVELSKTRNTAPFDVSGRCVLNMF